MTDLALRAEKLGVSKNLGVAAAIAIVVLVVVAPVIHHYGEQQGSRYAYTAALWDRHTFEIDEYAHLLGRDHVVFEGRTIYSDKAPGQPFLAVPFYALYRAVGGESPDRLIWDVDLGMWWLTIWSAAFPGAVLAVLMYRWAREVEADTALLATLTMAFGSMLLVYSTLLFGHVLAGLFAFAMFLLVRAPRASRARLIAAGALGGITVLTEFPVAAVVAVITIGAFVRHRARAVYVLLAGIPFALTLALYNNRLFGSPLVFSYQWTGYSGPREEAKAFVENFYGPTVERFFHVLISPRGLLIATPVVILAIAGLVLMWKQGLRFDSGVAAGAFIAMLCVQGSWANSYAGGAGPRYLVPALPFLVAPLAVAWRRWSLLTSVTAAISVLTMVAATLVEPQMGTDHEAGLRYWLQQGFVGDLEPNIYTVLLGPGGWVLYLGGIGVAIYLLWRTTRASSQGS